jgi:hypothetical protein
MKANIGRYLYSDNAVQKVILTDDVELQKAIEVSIGKIKKESKTKK